MSLVLTPQKMNFDSQEKVKQVKLTNITKKNGQNRPIMFKIKTNKIDLVDAKPSCGYISGKPGHNQINVAIRWLNNANENSAKLQILYVENSRITQEIVQKNSVHFNSDEYIQNYQAIKKESQNDVKTIILPVIRKNQQKQIQGPKLPVLNPKSQTFNSVKVQIKKSQPNNQLKNPPVQFQKPIQNNQSTSISLSKCLIFVLAAFLIGLLAGFSLGKLKAKQFSQVSQVSSRKKQASHSFGEKIEDTQKIDVSIPETIEENRASGSTADDLRESLVNQDQNRKDEVEAIQQKILADTAGQTL